MLKASYIASLSIAMVAAMALQAAAQDVEPESARRGGNRSVTPQAVGTNCAISKASFRTETSKISTSSTGFSNIPNTFVTFTQSATGCVIVRYSAESFSHFNAGTDVRAVLESGTVAAPGTVFWTMDHDEDGDARGFSAYAFDFVFPSVSPGSHTVRMQWRSTIAGVAAWQFFRTLTVQHQ
jgi:hypothetical protein